MRSAGAPRSTISSTSRSAIAATPGRSAAMRRAVNHRATVRRHRWCPSPDWGSTVATESENTPPSSEIRAASSASRLRTQRGSDNIRRTSSYRVSRDAVSPLGSVTGATGHVSRSRAHSGGGSSAVGFANG